MHFGLYVITEAENLEDAQDHANAYMANEQQWFEQDCTCSEEELEDDDRYCECDSESGGFWDWWLFGGRWHFDLLNAYPFGRYFSWYKEKILKESTNERWHYNMKNKTPEIIAEQARLYDLLDVCWETYATAPFDKTKHWYRQEHVFQYRDSDKEVLRCNIMPIDEYIYAYIVEQTKPDTHSDDAFYFPYSHHLEDLTGYGFDATKEYYVGGTKPYFELTEDEQSEDKLRKWVAVIDYHC